MNETLRNYLIGFGSVLSILPNASANEPLLKIDTVSAAWQMTGDQLQEQINTVDIEEKA